MEEKRITNWLELHRKKKEVKEEIKPDPETKPKGGKREGAGRKPKYKEETKVVAFRIPESKIFEITRMVNDKLKEYRDQ